MAMPSNNSNEFPVLMPQNIQGQVMMQVPMPCNGSDQTCIAWMPPPQGAQGVQNVHQMQFAPQISGQSQFSQDSFDQSDRISAFMDQGLPQQQQQQQQQPPLLLQNLLFLSPEEAQQTQQSTQQMPVDHAGEDIQMLRQRHQVPLRHKIQNLPRHMGNFRQQQQQQQPMQMMRHQQMMQEHLPQGLPQQPPLNLDDQPPGTWNRDLEKWLRPRRRMGGNNWEDTQQDCQQFGNAMPGHSPLDFGVETQHHAWHHGGNEDRSSTNKMNWAELSENIGEHHLAPGSLEFRAHGQRRPSRDDGQSRGMGTQRFGGPSAGSMRNQAMQQLMSQVQRPGGAERRGMDWRMPDGGFKRGAGKGGGRQNPILEHMGYTGSELMAGTGEAPTFGQPRDLWDGVGPMFNRGRGGPGDAGISGGRNTGERRRGQWGGHTQGVESGRNGNMPGAGMGAGNGQGRPPWNPGAGDTMKAQLQALQLEDPATVFIARRINKLGFTSAEQLEAHFSRYGEVKGVYVSHSRVKSLRAPGDRNDAHWRLRAAALGFVVMKSSEATAQILSEGSEHSVNGVTVRLQSFHRRNCADAAPGKDSCGQREEDPPQEFPRWPSPGSDDDRTQLPISLQLASPNKMPTADTTQHQIPGKAIDDPAMEQLYYNLVASGGPIIYEQMQDEEDMRMSFEDKIKKELTNAMPECYSD